MITKIPFPVKMVYPKRIWSQSSLEKTIYLTFDDGPIPQLTPWVLEQLEKYSAKATFFCIGDNIRKYPEIFDTLVARRHSIGNHTFNHLNGWITPAEEYFQNVLKAESLLVEKRARDGKEKLFRPPYGRLTGTQAKRLLAEDFKIVMWEVLSRDYEHHLAEEKCYHNVIRNAGPGSIVVFHDSLKAEKNLRAVLPRVLEYYSAKGYHFKGL